MKKDSQNSLKAAGYFLVVFGIIFLVYTTYVIYQILSGNFDMPYASLLPSVLQSDNGIYHISGNFNGERDDFNIEISAGLGIFLVALSFAIVVSSLGAIAGTAISSGVKMIYPPQYWEKRSGNVKTDFSD